MSSEAGILTSFDNFIHYTWGCSSLPTTQSSYPVARQHDAHSATSNLNQSSCIHTYRPEIRTPKYPAWQFSLQVSLTQSDHFHRGREIDLVTFK